MRIKLPPCVLALGSVLLALPNGDFESDLKGWDPFIPKESSDKNCKVEVADGGRNGSALRLSSDAPARYGVSRMVRLQPGKRYRLSAWLRAEGGEVVKGTPGAVVRLTPRAQGVKPIFLGTKGVAASFDPLAGEALPSEWTELQTEFDVGSSATEWDLGLFSLRGSGPIWFDDVDVKAVGSATADAPDAPTAAPVAAAPAKVAVARPASVPVASTGLSKKPMPATTDLLPSDEQIAWFSDALRRGRLVWGKPANDRGWEKVAGTTWAKNLLAEAEKDLGRPIPELTEEDFVTDGKNRSAKGAFMDGFVLRTMRLGRLALAECIENKGRFVADAEKLILAVSAEKNWAAAGTCYGDPAYFRGEKKQVELASAMRGWTVACAVQWLEPKLQPTTKEEVARAMRENLLDPYRSRITGGQIKEWFWVKGDNNWTAVVHGAVMAAALMTLEDPAERAWYASLYVNVIPNFARGYGEEGECLEGHGYWNYGFGHFVLGTEALRLATEGKVDVLAGNEKHLRMAAFARRYQIVDGIFPAFADVGPGTRPRVWLMRFVDRRFDTPSRAQAEKAEVEADIQHNLGATLYTAPLGLFLESEPRLALPDSSLSGDLWDHYPKLQAWFSRPVGRDPKGLGFAAKGGNNSGPHHQHDIGSFVVAHGGQEVLFDPGMDAYNKKNNTQRWESELNNSRGHSVPVVDGKLQSEGESFKSTVLEARSTERLDRFVLDLKAAYDVPDLKSLVRTFVYERSPGRSVLTVEDVAEFNEGGTLECALIHPKAGVNQGGNVWLFGEGPSRIKVTLTGEGGTVTSEVTPLTKSSGNRLPFRTAYGVHEKSKKIVLRARIEAAPIP